MIRLGQYSKLGQLVSHSFTAFPGPTVHNPTALPTSITNRRLREILMPVFTGTCQLTGFSYTHWVLPT